MTTSTLSPVRSTRTKRPWLAPLGLVLLTLVPIVAGASRLTQLTVGAAITPENARFFASPVPVAVHIVTASTFCLLGASQFVEAFRRSRLRWHRLAGRILVPVGLLAALSGLWMTLFYPRPEGDGLVLLWLRLLFGTAMIVFIVLGYRAARRRDFVVHSAWMTRAYAIGLGAGTQVLTNVPWLLLVGKPDEAARAVLMGAGWVINLAVAEYVIRRRLVGSPASGRADRAVGLLS